VDYLVDILTIAISLGGSFLIHRGSHRPHWRVPSSTDEHVHSFDTMLGDGEGWRCGVCGDRKDDVVSQIT
jgi:hypothetical protein